MAILFIITGRCRFLFPDFKAFCVAIPIVAILESDAPLEELMDEMSDEAART